MIETQELVETPQAKPLIKGGGGGEDIGREERERKKKNRFKVQEFLIPFSSPYYSKSG